MEYYILIFTFDKLFIWAFYMDEHTFLFVHFNQKSSTFIIAHHQTAVGDIRNNVLSKCEHMAAERWMPKNISVELKIPEFEALY